ncbi:MAG: CopG family transcriptional regulator [Candidatus Dadabacteria bacterium]|nr:CopG family transcriptional regulator [Candidatus Dadabacteria bacterium]NIS09980.1 CopG family transcriptional regulator [Candidatus Dadabacteria bacterium]NIY22955.1 ribbon-helix-helix protein, CopG family [Candidatus Dadabacteria bacterium]
MRTTVRLSDDLYTEVKEHALKTKRTFSEIVHDALISYISKEQSKQSPKKIKIPTFKGTGLQEGVNLDNNSEILDRMDTNDAL